MPPPIHNLTLIGNTTGILDLMQSVNIQLMGGYFGIAILFAVFVITFMGFVSRTGSTGQAFATSSFIVFAVAVPLRLTTLIPDVAVYGTLAMTAFAVAFLKSRD